MGFTVSTLEKLKNAKSLDDLAAMLGYKASGLSYIIYKLPPALKYHKFDIPKRGGGVRQICAPNPQLRVLQRHLANILYACREEIDAADKRGSLSHGFRKKHSIITNARPHKRRRYVLNLDIRDFFPSFNFGRVRGFFIKNHHFALDDKIATLIAQIACFENMLPQGSPCSPVIADLISHPMDVRLAQLAKQNQLTYSRYADDLTFSTSRKHFPPSVATMKSAGSPDWELGGELIKRIDKAGLTVNPAKTRMHVRTTQQLVTGLTVNAKVNIRAQYYRHTRSMCHTLFKHGAYYRPDDRDPITLLNPLEGILSHIHLVKDTIDQRNELEKIKHATASRKLYGKFLAYRYFVRLDQPLIICEGKTDNVYLKYAIRSLRAFHPKLGEFSGGTFESTISFFNYGNQAHKILQLNGGTGDLKHLIRQYPTIIKRYEHRPLWFPAIILIDNDDGAKEVFSTVKEIYKRTITLASTDDFYHLTDNLYLVKTVENAAGDHMSCIEDCFTKKIRSTKLNGKSFNPKKDFDSSKEYGKHYFAEKIVRPNASKINFKKFEPLLERLVAVIDHYEPPV
jgi:RNA-directed DNA polymerase